MFQWKTRMLAAFVGGLVASTAPAAFANDSRDVVREADGDIVRNTFGNCVRTQWTTGSDACGQKELSPARRLQTEERTVYFEFDKYRLTDQAKGKLNSLAEALRSDNEVRGARIVGYADPMGSASYNQQLSKRRALSVQNYLTSRGYLNSKVAETRWLGATSKYAECPTNLKRSERIACLQPNRRVEVEIDFYPEGQAPAPGTQAVAPAKPAKAAKAAKPAAKAPAKAAPAKAAAPAAKPAAKH